MARLLAKLLVAKNSAHYGVTFVSRSSAKSLLNAGRLVDEVRSLLTN